MITTMAEERQPLLGGTSSVPAHQQYGGSSAPASHGNLFNATDTTNDNFIRPGMVEERRWRNEVFTLCLPSDWRDNWYVTDISPYGEAVMRLVFRKDPEAARRVRCKAIVREEGVDRQGVWRAASHDSWSVVNLAYHCLPGTYVLRDPCVK